MLRIIIHYLSHLLYAKKKHGIHSPFVYELATKVFPAKPLTESQLQIEQLRNELKQDKRELIFEDLGAGSIKMKSEIKTVGEIANNSLKSKNQAALLYRIVDHFKPNNILELGTSLGLTSMYLALGNTQGTVTTIEGVKEIADIAMNNFQNFKFQNIKGVNGNFNDMLHTVIENIPALDLVYFDGNHQKDATLCYFEDCLKFANESSIFIFDDIYWSEEMTKAWEAIKNHPEVSVTVDVFHFGIVFFHKHQAKENFRIKIKA